MIIYQSCRIDGGCLQIRLAIVLPSGHVKQRVATNVYRVMKEGFRRKSHWSLISLISSTFIQSGQLKEAQTPNFIASSRSDSLTGKVGNTANDKMWRITE